MPADDLMASIEHLARLKDEHRPILSQVAADPGMSPATRRTLVEHLYEEEDEQVEAILALARGQALAPSAAGAGRSDGPPGRGGRPPTLTVGSLRPPLPDALGGTSGGPVTTGSLRAEHPAPGRPVPGGTVSGGASPPTLDVGSLWEA